MNRREFTRLVVAGLGMQAIPLIAAENTSYTKANTDWLAKCRFGIGVHWTVQTVPRQGARLPFQKAVDAFNLGGFIKAVEHTGADFVLFTAAHALQMLPAPHPVIDKILPGRTCQRDLIRELADALAAKKKHLLVYYNHSCNHQQDRPWEKAVDSLLVRCDRRAYCRR